jgi:hypothetical protein
MEDSEECNLRNQSMEFVEAGLYVMYLIASMRLYV